MWAPGSPDPIVSANIYCSGQLDEMIEGAVAPFSLSMASLEPSERYYLWFLRYDKRGEHLKIRVHAPIGFEESVKDLLRSAVERCLSETSAPEAPGEPGQEAQGASDSFSLRVPPMDAEDLQDEPHPDRTVRFTEYRRSAVSLGPEPYTSDETYLCALTRCLACGTRAVLRAATDEAGGGLAGQRQSTLLQCTMVALAGLELDRIDYLAYHRDWLVRLPLLKSNATPDHAQELLSRLDRFAAARAEQRAFLGDWAGTAWAPGADIDALLEEGSSELRDAFVELSRQVCSEARGISGRVDPFASDPVFPLVFKALHGIANQLGVSRFEEAFAMHLLLRSVGEGTQDLDRFSLLPFAVRLA